MGEFLERHPAVFVAALAVFGIVFVLAVVLLTMAKFYRRCGADEALVRTGAGGNKVVIGGGVTVYPILHQLLRVSLRSIKLSVERSGKNALVTRDKIKANVTTELYIKVEPIAEDVLAAARSFGERNLDEHAISELIEGKLTDALRSVAANQTFLDLHGKRKEFAEHIQAALTEELKKNGLTLENVSITALAMVPVKELDPHDVFDAEGLRAITDSVQSNSELTNRIQREKENAIKQTNVDARKRALEMEQEQAFAEADQARRVAEYGATQQAETARAVFMQQQHRETARIQQEQGIAIAQQSRLLAEREAAIAAEKAQMAAQIAKEREVEAATIEKQKVVQAAEIERQKALEAATIVKEQAVETARIAKQIAVTRSEEEAARAAALKSAAESEQQRAAQAIITVELTAKANREKEIAIIKADEAAQQSRIAAEREAFKARVEAEARAAAVKAQADGAAAAQRAQAEGEVARAKGVAESQQLQAEAQATVVRTAAQAEADRERIAAEARAAAAQLEAAAMMALADATLRKGQAEAEARRLTVEAENAVDTRIMMRDATLKMLDVLPAVTRELMAPAKAISEVKVLQVNGLGANGHDGAAGAGAFGAASPILKTILEAGAAYPLLKEMMQFSQVDTSKLADKAGALLGSLPAELQRIVDADPALAQKVAELTGRARSIEVAPVAAQADKPAAPAAQG